MPSAQPAQQAPTHVLQELGYEHRIVDDTSYVRAGVLPGMLVPGTDLVRVGVLVILADLAAGQTPLGPVTPTTDLSVHVARPRPMRAVDLAARVLKAGSNLLVVETLLTADDEDEPFATSLATFLNQPVGLGHHMDRSDVRLAEPIDERIGTRVLAPGIVEVDANEDIGNGIHGTIQGGVQATVGELAAESLFADDEPHVVTGLDIRFLNRLKVGPLRAVARPVLSGRCGRVVDVTLLDGGNSDRVVSHVSTTCVRRAELV